MTVVQVGALFVALGSTMQALRWLLSTQIDLEHLHGSRVTRSDRLRLRLDLKRARTDWIAWGLVAIGSWYTVIGGLV